MWSVIATIKKIHVKKYYRSFKREQSKNREKDKVKQGKFGSKGKAKVVEINVVQSLVDSYMHESSLTDVLVFTSNVALEALLVKMTCICRTTSSISGTTFHVTPQNGSLVMQLCMVQLRWGILIGLTYRGLEM